MVRDRQDQAAAVPGRAAFLPSVGTRGECQTFNCDGLRGFESRWGRQIFRMILPMRPVR